jgi:hypothetical protein
MLTPKLKSIDKFELKMGEFLLKTIKENPAILHDQIFKSVLNEFIKNSKKIKTFSGFDVSYFFLITRCLYIPVKDSEIVDIKPETIKVIHFNYNSLDFLYAINEIKILGIKDINFDEKLILTLGELKKFVLNYPDFVDTFKSKYCCNIKKYLETWLLFYDRAYFDDEIKVNCYNKQLKMWKQFYDKVSYLDKKYNDDCILAKIYNQKKDKLIFKSSYQKDDEDPNGDIILCKNDTSILSLQKEYMINENQYRYPDITSSDLINVNKYEEPYKYWFELKNRKLDFIFDDEIKI